MKTEYCRLFKAFDDRQITMTRYTDLPAMPDKWMEIRFGTETTQQGRVIRTYFQHMNENTPHEEVVLVVLFEEFKIADSIFDEIVQEYCNLGWVVED